MCVHCDKWHTRPQVEKLSEEFKQALEEVKNLKDANAAQAAKLEDANVLLQVCVLVVV